MAVSLPVELPDNLAACHAVILRQAEVIAELTARVEEQAARIEELLARIERLNRDLAAVKRQLFGSRRERFVADSEAEEAESDVGVPPCEMERDRAAGESCVGTSASASRRTSKGRQKRTIDASIPREKVLHPLDEKNVPPEPRGSWVRSRSSTTSKIGPGT